MGDPQYGWFINGWLNGGTPFQETSIDLLKLAIFHRKRN
jgi:hypothetical protein